MTLVAKLSHLTGDLPGIGGAIKQRPEDFLVEEQPLYEPVGEGEHAYLFVEKRNMTTPQVVRRLAKAFGVSRSRVGYAGLKDKHAVARQHFSVHLPEAADQDHGLHDLEHHPKLKVLWADRHTNKLRRGHLAGNRFVIRIRGVASTAAIAARSVLDRLERCGIPDFLGEQRFGYRQNSHVLGKMVLLGEHQAMLDEMLGRPRAYESPRLREARAAYDRGDYEAALEAWPGRLREDRQALDALRQGRTAEQAVRAIHRRQREFLINAWQSAIFNDVLDRRLHEGTFDVLLTGDLAWKHQPPGAGAVFAVDEALAAQENKPGGRVESLNISPSGPMWGPRMLRPEGRPGRIELAALHEQGVNEEQLDGDGSVSVRGGRRPLRVPLKDPDLSGGVDEHGSYVRVAFELPGGAYATIALREIMKSRPAAGSAGEQASGRNL